MGFPRPSDPQPMYASRMGQYGGSSQRVSALAIGLEAICAFFGVYGVGWLISGHIATGVLVMIAGFIWDLIAAVLLFFTFGLAGVCVGPLHFAFIGLSTILLALHRRPQ